MAKKSGSGAGAAVVAAVVFFTLVLFRWEWKGLRLGWRAIRSWRSMTTSERWRSTLAGSAALLLPIVFIAAAASPSGSTAVAPAAASGPTTPASTPNSSPTTTLATSAADTSAPATTRAKAVAPASPTPRPHAVTSASGETILPGGIILPNKRLTPGATNPAVQQATIRSTICLTGYTKTIRPPSSYTTGLKEQQLAAGYAFHGDDSTSDYEEDHLISLELGGSPRSVQNLWPEPYVAAEGARVKDRIENKLHDLVCSGALSLRTAQQAIASNWWTAYQHYGGEGVASVWFGAYDTSTSTGTSTAPGGSTASSSSACTQTSSGSCIKAGEFCPTASDGQYGYDAQGRRLICRDRHWEIP